MSPETDGSKRGPATATMGRRSAAWGKGGRRHECDSMGEAEVGKGGLTVPLNLVTARAVQKGCIVQVTVAVSKALIKDEPIAPSGSSHGVLAASDQYLSLHLEGIACQADRPRQAQFPAPNEGRDGLRYQNVDAGTELWIVQLHDVDVAAPHPIHGSPSGGQGALVREIKHISTISLVAAHLGVDGKIRAGDGGTRVVTAITSSVLWIER